MNLKRYFVLVFLLIYSGFSATKVKGQGYSINVSKSSFKISSVQYQGFKTTTSRPYKEFKKAWWRYIKAKTYIFNYKTHYELKIPSRKTEEEILLVSTISEGGKGRKSILYIAISENTKLNEQETKEYKADIKALLIDFKVAYYSKLLQQEISPQEKKVKKLSKEISHISELKSKEFRLLESRLNIETNKLERLKKQLRLIK